MKKLMRSFLLLFCFLTESFFLYSQQPLTKDLNMYRFGDMIVKQQLTCKDPGRAGENVLWDFSNLDPVNEKYKLYYSGFNERDSLIMGIEHGTVYYYGLQGDSLLNWGYENTTTRLKNRIPELALHYPFSYKDKVKSHYYGTGVYCERLSLSVMGTTESEVDATGTMILPNEDTLRNVVRTKTVKLIAEKIHPFSYNCFSSDSLNLAISADSIDTRLKTDSLVMAVETYKWYAAGYRYPIFETIRTGNPRDNLQTEYFTTSFFYPPNEHTYLENDEGNLAVQEKIKNGDYNSSFNPLSDFSYHIYPNPVEGQLTIECFLSEVAKISYCIYSMSGQLLFLSPEKTLSNGAFADLIDMNSYAKGNYLLKMNVNGKIISENIIKK